MRMPVTASLVIVVAATVAVAQDVRFQTATTIRTSLAPVRRISDPAGRKGNHNRFETYCVMFMIFPTSPSLVLPIGSLRNAYDMTAQAAGKPSRGNLKQMMSTFSAAQFELVLHQEARSLPVFKLRQSRTDESPGPNMIPSKTSCEIGGTAACRHELTGELFTAVAIADGPERSHPG